MTDKSAQNWVNSLKTDKPLVGKPHKKDEYTSKDFESIIVGHKSLDLPVGHTEVLVLNDQSINDESAQDALVSIKHLEMESCEKRASEVKKKRKYNPFEEEEDYYSPLPSTTPITTHYNQHHNKQPPLKEDKLEGKAKELDSKMTLSDLLSVKPQQNLSTERPQQNLPTEGSGLGNTKDLPSLPNKDQQILKKRNVRRKIVTFTDEPVPLEIIEDSSKPPPLPLGESSTLALDDEDLQLALSKNRRQNVRAMLAKSNDYLGRNVEIMEEEEEENVPFKDGGLIFSEATDFISSVSIQVDPLGGIPDQLFKAGGGDKEGGDKLDSGDKEEAFIKISDRPFEREPLVRRGVAATLQFLSKLGIRPQLGSERRRGEEGGGNHHPHHHHHSLEQKKFVPRFADIKVEHYDESGNLLTAKEAYKILSHKFHGKTPGKGKQEKLRRRKEQAQRIQATSLVDTPLGTAAAQRERQKTTGTVHIVLSQGSHAARIETNAIAVNELQRQQKPIEHHRASPSPSSSLTKKSTNPPVKKKPRIFGMK